MPRNQNAHVTITVAYAINKPDSRTISVSSSSRAHNTRAQSAMRYGNGGSQNTVFKVEFWVSCLWGVPLPKMGDTTAHSSLKSISYRTLRTYQQSALDAGEENTHILILGVIWL